MDRQMDTPRSKADARGLRAIRLSFAMFGLMSLLCTKVSAQELILRATLPKQNGPIVSLAFERSGKTLASGSADNSAKLWDTTRWTDTTTFPEAGGDQYCYVAFSPDGNFLASACRDGTIKLWHLVDRKRTTLFNLPGASQYGLAQVVFDQDGKTLCGGGRCFHSVSLWHLAPRTCTCVGILRMDEWGAMAFAFAGKGNTLVSVAHDGRVTLRNAASRKLLGFFSTGSKTVYLAAFNQNGQTLAVSRRSKYRIDGDRIIATAPGEISLWDVAARKRISNIEISRPDVCCMALSPDGKALGCGLEDGTIGVWEVATGKRLAKVAGENHDVTVTALAFSPDNKMLVSGSEDGTIKAWILKTKQGGAERNR